MTISEDQSRLSAPAPATVATGIQAAAVAAAVVTAVPAMLVPVATVPLAMLPVAAVPARVIIDGLRRRIGGRRLHIYRCRGAERESDAQIRVGLRDTARAGRKACCNKQMSDDALHGCSPVEATFVAQVQSTHRGSVVLRRDVTECKRRYVRWTSRYMTRSGHIGEVRRTSSLRRSRKRHAPHRHKS